jgi:anhydro-N-acetylmuramic acid kinase
MAAAGTPDRDLLAELLGHPYFASPPPKTTGRELFGAQLVDPFLEHARRRGLGAADVVATLTAFTARAIAAQYQQFLPARPDEVVVGGGGTRNPVLMGMLRDLLAPARVRPHEEFGLPSAGREAVCFALMGHEALHGRPNTIPACTGADHPVVMGKIVPGPNYRDLLRRVLATPERRPTRLRVAGTED